jgi:CBS domain-containing protein
MRRTDYLTEKRDFHKLTAGLLMEDSVMTCQLADTGRHLASQLTKHGFGSVPIVNKEGDLVGLVSEFDLLKVLMEGRELKTVRAEDIMTRDLKVVQENTLVEEVIRVLETNHLIRVPVLKDGKLTGILARRDVLFGYIKATAQYWP